MAGSRSRRSPRRSSKGGFGGVGKIVWAVVAVALVFGVYGIPSNPSAKGIIEILVSKSETLKSWVTGVGQDLDGAVGDGVIPGTGGQPGTGGGQPGTGTGGTTTPDAVTGAQAALGALAVGDKQQVSYNRDEWNHWITQGSGCWDTRDKVLYDEAVKDATLVLVDKDKKTTTDVAAACAVTAGTWNDPYTGKVFTNPKDLDIDHLVPLGYAAGHGGQAWDSNRKQQYANDTSNPQHLLAVDASSNRQKGDKGPAEWKPSNAAYQCQYALDWISVTSAYGLTISQGDKDALSGMLATCKV